jgi:hypothetical protein
VYLLTLFRVNIVIVLTISGSSTAYFVAAISFSNRVLGVAHRRILTYGEVQACRRCARHATGAGEYRVEHAAWKFHYQDGCGIEAKSSHVAPMHWEAVAWMDSSMTLVSLHLPRRPP